MRALRAVDLIQRKVRKVLVLVLVPVVVEVTVAILAQGGDTLSQNGNTGAIDHQVASARPIGDSAPSRGMVVAMVTAAGRRWPIREAR